MAGNAAHITYSLQVKPSIFEVIAQESLCELLYPSFKILVQFLASAHPRRYGWLSEWYEEVFLGLNGLLQLHYLNDKGSSFSESFYGLRRVSAHGQPDGLSVKAKYWSLFCLVGLPYLAHKAEQYTSKVESLKIGELVNRCHRTVVASWRTVCLVQYLLYLTGRVHAHSPLLSAASLSLQYCPEQPASSISWTDMFSSPRACGKVLSTGLSQGLELAAFFLQCLQWWHSDELGHDKIASVMTPPPPPSLNADINTSNPGVCPVCKQPCNIETALMTSGYVFCFRCVRDAVISKQACPVTGLPTTLDELVRLYPTK